MLNLQGWTVSGLRFANIDMNGWAQQEQVCDHQNIKMNLQVSFVKGD